MNSDSPSVRPRAWKRTLLMFVALLYAAATLLYSIIWMIDSRTGADLSKVELGFNNSFVLGESAYLVKEVYGGSPAENSGMMVGDKILWINGKKIDQAEYLDSLWRLQNAGDTVRLAISRPGVPKVFTITAVFRLRQNPSSEGGLAHFANEVKSSFPVPFVIVGLVVLFLRLEDPMAWLLALLLGCFVAAPGFATNLRMAPALRIFGMGYRAVFSSLLGPFFYSFFAVFPVQSPVDRRVPWLKWLSVILGISFGISGFTSGDMFLPPPLIALAGGILSKQITFVFSGFLLALGLISLVLNFKSTQDTGVRRKIRVILWGAGVAIVPILIQTSAENFAGFHTPNWLATLLIILLFLLPLSIAYGVVRHRVLEIPVLLKRSARYLLVQRGFTFLLSLLSIGLILLFALSLSSYLQPMVQIAQPFAIALGSVFGTALLWGGTQVHRQVSGRIDKAFFRRAYDARLILENLAEKSSAAKDRGELAHLLEVDLQEALQPTSLAVYLRSDDEQLELMAGSVSETLRRISVNSPMLVDLTQKGEPMEVPLSPVSDKAEKYELAPLRPECLTPLVRRGKLVGLLVLSSRLSEEPYSGEDKRLLASVATQAATALENMSLAKEIADQIENERRVVSEMELSRRMLEADNARKTKELEEARVLQLSMLPKTLPDVPNLEIAVFMKTATEVGGDYYDFSVSKDGTLTVALGDATGHGAKAGTMVVAAKSLFHGFADTPDLLEILERLSSSIKRLNIRSVYMSMLLLRIKDKRAVVTSAGMPCPFVYRAATSRVEQVDLKGMPLGAFREFPYAQKEVALSPGDTIVLMSDGFPEMFNEKQEMFGLQKITDLLRDVGETSPENIISELTKAGEEWANGRPQDDDITFVVLKVK